MDIATSAGTAAACLDGQVHGARFLLALTHGAGGCIEAPDLLAARTAALRLGGVVARVLQPYRMRGARAPGDAGRQDAAWIEIAAALRDLVPGVPYLQGGRSNGARVACRTAGATAAEAVVALAFPLHPPGKPEKSRLAELRDCGVPALVVSGARDPFGIPGSGDADEVVIVPGETHALRGHSGIITAAVERWLPTVLRTLSQRG